MTADMVQLISAGMMIEKYEKMLRTDLSDWARKIIQHSLDKRKRVYKETLIRIKN